MAFASEVQENLTHALRIGDHLEGSLRGFDEQAQVLAAAQAVDLGDACARELRDVDRGEADLDASGFGFGEVEDIVDEAEQMLAVALDALERLAGARRELLLGRRDEQIREAEDGRQRRPKLVAHRRQELGLHLVGLGQALALLC